MAENNQTNIQFSYEKLRKKYSLPPYEDLNNEFEIGLIEHDEFLLREIQHRIFEKVDFFVHIIEQLLQPDTNSISQMNEYRFVEDKEKIGLFNFYRKLMNIHRELLSLSIENNDEKSSQFIAQFLKQWPSLKNDINSIVKKLSDSWIKSTETSYKADYLG